MNNTKSNPVFRENAYNYVLVLHIFLQQKGNEFDFYLLFLDLLLINL